MFLLLLLAAACLGAQNRVRVRNGGELAQAIGSNRLVVLAAGEYRVSEAAQVANPAVSWEPVFDGLQLVVTGDNHLTLRGRAGAALLASPRYANTLLFRDCQDLCLEELTLGHTEAGECVGGVLRLEGCSEVRIEDCQLFGSGVMGLDLEGCSGVTVLRSTIRDCTSGALSASGVQNLRLEGVRLTGNQSWPLVWIDASRGVVLDSYAIEGNRVQALFPLDSLRPELVQTTIVRNAFEMEEEMVESGEGDVGDYPGEEGP